MISNPITYRVRIAETRAIYLLIDAANEDEATKTAEWMYNDKNELDLTRQNAHVNHTIEVEEIEEIEETEEEEVEQKERSKA